MVDRSASQSSPTIDAHSVTSTAASAPLMACSAEVHMITPCSRSAAPSTHRVVGAHLGTLRQQARGQHEARRLAHVVGLGLEGQAEQSRLCPPGTRGAS